MFSSKLGLGSEIYFFTPENFLYSHPPYFEPCHMRTQTHAHACMHTCTHKHIHACKHTHTHTPPNTIG